jgi:carbonic anhydrase
MASKEELIAELTKRGATMAQVALLKDPTAQTPEEAIELLQTGNSRFFSGQPQRVHSDVNSRRAQIIAQTPFAVVLGCADSRVPIELVFDQGPGDLFSIRVAGNVVEAGTLGSIQYAIRHLKVKLVVVLGHEGCGAVAASLLSAEERAAEPLHVRFLLDAIVPALEGMPPIQDRKAQMREAVVLNVRRQKALLEQDDVVREAIESGNVKVVGAFYEIGSGAVDFLEG